MNPQEKALREADVSPARFRIILIIFLLSGASGLIYEVVWVRELTLIFGTTVYAVTTVLCAFMAGLALGSYAIGKIADRHACTLRLYAYLEIGVGIFAVLMPLVFWMLERFYIIFYHGVEEKTYLVILVRSLLALAVLLIPTTLMGGTLPALSRYFVRRESRVARGVGNLYFANTAGAVIGCFLCGFYLIELLGVRETNFLAALGSFIAAFVAFRLSQANYAGRPEPAASPSAGEGERRSKIMSHRASAPHDRFILLVFGISGLCALAYEVLWTRILVLFIGSTTYAFATMLSTFLLGLALGSAVMARRADRLRDPLHLFALLEILIALFCLGGLSLIPAFDPASKFIQSHVPFAGWWQWMGRGFFLSLLLMAVPTFLSGATFPVAARIYVASLGRLGERVGTLYAANTVGAIIGSFAAGFIFLPVLGIQKSIVLVAAFNALIGIAVIIRNPVLPTPLKGVSTLLTAIVFVAIAVQLPLSLPLVLHSSKVYREGDQLLFYEEDPDTTVLVLRGLDGVQRLYSNRDEAAEDSEWDLPSHKIIAHIPLLLHPAPQRALVIGFGMGTTTYSITCYGTKVDAVEISPGIIRANPFFAYINHSILRNPLVRIIINDGRNYALVTKNRYDMISSGIIHPIVNAGSASFYSRDFYESCKRILTKNGVMSQWVPLHYIPPEHFLVIVRTFHDVFPNTSIWFKFTNNFITLIGTPEPLRIDFADWKRRMALSPIADDLKTVHVLSPYDLLDSFGMTGEELRDYVGEGPLHTDNRPYVEFFGSRNLSRTVLPNLYHLAQSRQKVFPYLRNIPASGESPQNVASELERYFEATQHTLQGEMNYVVGKTEEEIREYQVALQTNPDDPTTSYLLHLAGRNLEAKTIQRANSLAEKGRLDLAIREYEQTLSLLPHFAVGYNNLGYLYQESDRLEDAVAAYQAALRINPQLATAHYNLGFFYAEKLRDYDAARQQFNQALAIDPAMTSAREALEKLPSR